MRSSYDEDLPMEEVVSSFEYWNTADNAGRPCRLITEEYTALQAIKRLEDSLNEFLEKGRFTRLHVAAISVSGPIAKRPPIVLRNIVFYRPTGLSYWKSIFGYCNYSPMVEAYIKVVENWSEKIRWSREEYQGNGGDEAYVNGMNGFLDDLYRCLSDPVLKRQMHNHVRKAEKNYHSVCDFVGNMFRKHARVLVVRLDLSYGKYNPYFGVNTQGLLMSGRISHEIVSRHRQKLITSLKHRFGAAWIGYMWKLEYTLEKGFHYHMFIFLNGNKHREDVSLAQEVGECWKQDITRGMGLYYNCNAIKKTYGERNALGEVHYSNLKKVNNLKRAAGYLTKIDLLVSSQTLYKHRNFGKSEMPEVPILPKGRKRSFTEGLQEMIQMNGGDVENYKKGLTPFGLKKI